MAMPRAIEEKHVKNAVISRHFAAWAYWYSSSDRPRTRVPWLFR